MIPSEKHYIIKQACDSLALAVMDEDGTTPNHNERVSLARKVLQTAPDMSLPQKLAEIAEANVWGSPITWDTVTDDQIKTAISNVWTPVAVAMYSQG